MFKGSPASLRTTLDQLEAAARELARWQEGVLRTIVCRLPVGFDGPPQDSHRKSRFGRWYYGQVPGDLRDQPAFASIESEHRAVHEAAARLLKQSTTGDSVRCDDYDAFVAAAARLRLELDSLRHEIQAALRSSDVLTGAYGRSEVLPELREWRELVRRGVSRCVLAFMDVDHLKSINDQHGHAAGDQVLAGVVHYLANHLRPYDKIFRYGGDEFLVLLPGASLEDARRVMERVRRGIAGTLQFECVDGQALGVTASFGLVELDPDERIEESIDRADQALLLAKASGRNRVLSWDPAAMTGRHPAWRAEPETEAVSPCGSGARQDRRMACE